MTGFVVETTTINRLFCGLRGFRIIDANHLAALCLAAALFAATGHMSDIGFFDRKWLSTDPALDLNLFPARKASARLAAITDGMPLGFRRLSRESCSAHRANQAYVVRRPAYSGSVGALCRQSRRRNVVNPKSPKRLFSFHWFSRPAYTPRKSSRSSPRTTYQEHSRAFPIAISGGCSVRRGSFLPPVVDAAVVHHPLEAKAERPAAQVGPFVRGVDATGAGFSGTGISHGGLSVP